MAEVHLPQEILCQIFLHLDGRSVYRCRAVSRSWKDAVDSLSHASWKKICANDPSHLDCATIYKKSGLPWRDTFRALHSWKNIDPEYVKTSLLCQFVTEFKVLPIGLIACIIIKKEEGVQHLSDTIVYFDTETSQRVYEQHFDFNFLPSFYDENQQLQVFVAEEHKKNLIKDLRLCLIVKKTKIKYVVDDYILTKYNRLEATLMEKEFYYRKNKSDSQIYCSKLTNNDILETNFFGNLKFEDEPREDASLHIKQFVIKNGDLYIHCGEESEIFIFRYQNYEFICIYKTLDLFVEASLRTLRSDFGFHWLEDKNLLDFFYIHLFSDFPLYSNGIVVLRHFREENLLTVYNVTQVTYYEDLVSILEDGQNVICTFSLDDVVSKEHQKFIQINIDVVETSNSNKILISTFSSEHKLFVYEFPHGPQPQHNVGKRTDSKESKRCKRACSLDERLN